MATFDGNFSGRAVILRLDVVETSYDAGSNSSQVSWNLKAVRNGAVTAWKGDPSNWAVNIHGQVWSGTWAYNFGSQSEVQMGSGSRTVYHNPDGTGTIAVEANAQTNAELGFASVGPSNLVLTTLGRASIPQFSVNPVDAGGSTIIYTYRASSDYVHTVYYNFGTSSGIIGTNITDGVTWNLPLNLLGQMKNSTTGYALVSIDTYSSSSGALVGTASSYLTINAPASAVPSFTTVTASEATSGVSTKVGSGVYVQNISKLNLAITGAAGNNGSTITNYKIEVAGQTINAQSGVSSPLTASGTVPIVATITDSRGRTASKTVSINVLAYIPPTINTMTLQRALVDGTIAADTGLYIRTTLNAVVASLINGTQKNKLTYKISTRARGTSTWTLKKTSNLAAGTLTFNSYDLISSYSTEQAWDVLVEVSDIFATTAIQGVIATAGVFMHWGGQGQGIGIGKFWEQGALDVNGEIFNHNGSVVEPAGVIVATAAATAATGWLLCQGQAVSRSTYLNLYNAIGTTYGAGDGTTTFNVPNLKGKVIVGIDTGQTEFDTRGETGGEKAHILTIAEMPAHTHNTHIDTTVTFGSAGGTFSAVATGTTQFDNGASTGGGLAHNNLQPYMALNYIIKT